MSILEITPTTLPLWHYFNYYKDQVSLSLAYYETAHDYRSRKFNWFSNLFSLFFLVKLRTELRISHLQSRHSATWDTSPVHFTLVILEMGGRGEVLQTICPGWPLNCNPEELGLQVWATGTFFFLLLLVLRFELSALRLLGRHSITWARLPVLF
jgi:hypothetical protein